MKRIAWALAIIGALTMGAAPSMAGDHGHRGHHGHHHRGHYGGHGHGHHGGHHHGSSFRVYVPSYGCYDDYSYRRSYYDPYHYGPRYGASYYSPGFSFSFGR